MKYNYGALRSSVTMWYADKKVGATQAEKRSYNTTDRILLSFDDFTEPDKLDQILDILADKNVKAAFFIVGNWAIKHPNLIEKIKYQGHWVGNHTWSHRSLVKLSDDEIRLEITKGPQSSLLRPPYGAYNNRVRKIADSLGYKICYWGIDSEDWKGLNTQQIQERVYRALKPGSCVLLHLNGEHTTKALRGLIDGIRSRQFKLCVSGEELAL